MPIDMRLLNEIFPGLEKLRIEGIPDWSEFNNPWEILQKTQGGLLHQLSERIGEDGVYIHESALVADCVSIEGPSFVGPESVIRHGAYLRKGSWICEGAIVGHSSEIKNSILLPGSKAPHFNYVGDSILGINVNLGAGAKLSNVRNDRNIVLVTMSDGERIETSTNKLGSLIGDGSQIGCNVVANPGTIVSPNSMISPNETISGWYEN